METIHISYPTDWKEYELIDTGDGEKLERFGSYVMIRPDPRIIWNKTLPKDVWNRAEARYIRTSQVEGHWDIKTPPPSPWRISYGPLVFTLRPTEFKHTGVFPEQAANWKWLRETIAGKPLSVLNLFAYTGGATLASLEAGASVTHVDSVKSAIDWAHDNTVASSLSEKPIRWIIEDAQKFVLKEIKRGNTYDGIIMDPPRFGRGTKGEIWKLEKDLPKLLQSCKHILSPHPAFVLVNAYTADISPIALKRAVSDLCVPPHGICEAGELTLRESSTGEPIPNGIFVRWNA